MAAAASLAAAGAAQALTVLGTDDIFAAGLTAPPASPPGSTGSAGTLPSFITVTPGEHLYISASGAVECCIGGAPNPGASGPNGFATNPFGPPAGSDISDSGGRFGDFVETTGAFPLAGAFTTSTGGALGSVFQVGANDALVVPSSAGRLYFGLPDAAGFNGASGYYQDNGGAFTVNVSTVPEPAAWALLILGVGLAGWSLRSKHRLLAA
ncbi:MAG: PEPxxWA-CTERM sorting domain-containing protein [Caulobacteraceae bacterium]